MAKKTASGVNYVRIELSRVVPQYALIRDCIEGEFAIKGYTRETSPLAAGLINIVNESVKADISKAQRYLPKPNASDTSSQNSDRYLSYLTRAVFYNVTGRTLEGMVGEVFKRDPVVKLPTVMNFMLDDADGSGVGLTQLAKRGIRYVLPYGRAGVFVDFPQTTGSVTKSDIDNGIRPTITFYEAWNVINWKTTKVNGETVLSLVVLREQVDISSDEYASDLQDRYRVLKLNTSGPVPIYSQELHKPKDDKNFDVEIIAVTDASGSSLTRIPFMFVGSENTDSGVDKPPMFDLATINIAHYRNSADYEESAYICGQPTIVATGLDENWVKNILKGVLPIGSRGGIPLPPGAQAQLLQADPNTMPKEAMEQKERQMVALGAKLVQQQQVQRTATDALMEGSSETSILANVTTNVSTAILWALNQAYKFLSASTAEIKFQLNDQFQLNQLSADDQAKLVANWQKGAIAYPEMRNALRKAGIAYMTDEEARADSQQDLNFITDFMTAAKPPVTPAGPAPSKAPAAHAQRPAARGVRT
jgi:hypothetical protein